jgi:alpha-tubulin suppressor-like RCC1 family protein
LVSSVLFVSLLIVGCGGGGGGDNKNNNGNEVKFKTIIAGGLHSFALSNNGKVYATGYNESGQLGLGDNTHRNTFKEVSLLNDKNITAIFAGINYSFAISSNGKVYATGWNHHGQLGLGDNTNRNAFTEVTDLSDKNIIAISARGSHSLALSNNGKVYATGNNAFGELGLGDNTHRNTFKEVSSLNGKNIIALSAGRSHSLALSNNGKVYAAGANSDGQLGLGDNTHRNTFNGVTSISGITSIFAAGGSHSLALSSDGKVYAAGVNNHGQLGLGDTANRNTFTKVSLLNDKNITALSAGQFHSLALSNDGKVYAAGDNDYGQLGLGDNTDRNTFNKVTLLLSDKNITAISAGYDHSLALSNGGKIYATGRNDGGRLGLGDTTNRNVFTKVTVLDD